LADDSVPAELADLQLFSSRMVRKILGISKRTLCKWIESRVIPEPVLLPGPGGLHYWRASVIREWIERKFEVKANTPAVA
jgi:predicted DNA-binding transcriptional regulator AlpA